MRYIINSTRDYADEFDYTIRSYLTQEKINCLNENRDFIISVFEDSDSATFECYFGTNEGFDISIHEFFDLILDAKEISEKEYLILKKFEQNSFIFCSICSIIIKLSCLFEAKLNFEHIFKSLILICSLIFVTIPPSTKFLYRSSGLIFKVSFFLNKIFLTLFVSS